MNTNRIVFSFCFFCWCAAAPVGSVLHLKFDGGKIGQSVEKIIDSSRKFGNEGDIFGELLFCQGVDNTGLKFNGEEYIEYKDSSDYNFSDEFTLEVFIKVEQVEDGSRGIISKGDSGNFFKNSFGLNISVVKPDAFYFWFGIGNGTTGNAMEIRSSYNQWYYIAGVVEKNQLSFYRDGQLIKSVPRTVSPAENELPLFIGKVNKCFQGVLDEVVIYNRALTKDEILKRYQENASRLTAAISKPGTDDKPAIVLKTKKKDVLPSKANAASPEAILRLAFDEGKIGSTVELIRDLSKNQNEGEINGVLTYCPGMIKAGVKFSGDEYINFPDSDCFNFADEFTLEACIKVEQTEEGSRGIISKGDSRNFFMNSFGLNISVVKPDNFYFWFGIGDGTTGNAMEIRSAYNQLSHILAVVEKNQLSFYRDGRLVKSTPRTVSPIENNFPLLIGKSFNCFQGEIDEIAIYRRAFTQDEVLKRYEEIIEKKSQSSINFISILKNHRIEVFFDESSGGLQVKSALFPDREFLSRSKIQPLWKLRVQADGKSADIEASGNRVKISRMGETVSMVWPELKALGHSLQVWVTGQLRQAEPDLSYWNIEIINSSPLCVRNLDFPQIQIRTETNGSDYLAVPQGQGVYYENPAQNKSVSFGYVAEYSAAAYGFIGRKYPGTFQTMQFVVYQGRDSGVYLAAHDPDAHYKQFGYVPAFKHGLECRISQALPDMTRPGNSFHRKYESVIGCFRGDWYDGAMFYRRWATNQIWCGKGPLAVRTDIPEWFKKCPVWISFFYYPPSVMELGSVLTKISTEDSNNYRKGKLTWSIAPGLKDLTVTDVLIEIKKRLGNPKTMGFHWYGALAQMPYFMCSAFGQVYNSNLAEFCSYRETPDMVKILKQNGIHTTPYTDPFLYEETLPSWSEGRKWSVKNEAGEVVTGYLNPDGHKCPAMCVHNEWLRNKWSDFLISATKSNGFSGYYLDQITAQCPELCFDESHGHTLGGGSHYAQGWRAFLSKVRKDLSAVNPNNILYSECAGEPYIDLLDGNLSLTPASGPSFPLYKAVYGDYAILFGRKPAAKLLLEKTPGAAVLAEMFTRGEQLLWFCLSDRLRVFFSDDDLVSFTAELVKAFEYAQPFIVEGALQRQPVMKCLNEETIPMTNDNFSLPPVLHNLYRSYNNRLGFVMANYYYKPQRVLLKINTADYGFTGKKYTVTLWEKEKSTVSTLNGTVLEINREIAAYTPAVYVITPLK